MDPVTGAIVAQAVGVGAETGGNIGMYYLQRHHAKLDYERNRRDALSDFQMANRYNSPEEQMNRLREAGLNPHLVYGKGADQAAVQMKGPNLDTPIAPKISPIDINKAKSMGQALAVEKAHTDNILADTKNKELQSALLGAQTNETNMRTANIAQNTATSEFELGKAKELKDILVEKARLDNQAMETANTVALTQLDIAKVKSDSDKAVAIQNIAESKQRVLTAQLQNATLPLQKQKLEREIAQLDAITVNHNLEGAIKLIELKLREDGINPNDPVYVKKLWEGLLATPNFIKEQAPKTVMKYYWGAK